MSTPHPDNDREKLSGDVDITERSPLLRWLDNFWYHHKWMVIVIAFFAIVVIVCVAQMTSDPAYDVNIGYSGPYGFSATEAEQMYYALSNALPQDFNGDGEKHAGFIRYQVYSEEEIKAEEKRVKEAREAAEAKGEDPSKIPFTIDLSYNSTQYQQFTNSLLTGQCYVFLCSPFIYEDLKTSGRVTKLADITDSVPTYAYDECAVLLKDTPMYQQSEMLKKLPENTLVCLLTEIPRLFSQSNEGEYETAIRAFLGLIQ